MAVLSSHHKGHFLSWDHHDGRPKVTLLLNEGVSELAAFSGLIITISCVIFFLIKYYIFEGFLLERVYGDIYTKLNENRRRAFINHHVAATAKIVMFVSGAYPLCSILGGYRTMHDPFAGSKIVTIGDVLIVETNIFITMYISELFTRTKLSHIAAAHHIGAITIGAAAIAMTLQWEHQKDATLEYVMCFLWGLFDVVAEFYPHVAVINLRMRPNDHNYLRKVFLANMIVAALSTLIETIVVFYFWGWAWDRWTLGFKLATPMLHILFSAAQLWGAYNFYGMWQNEKKALRNKDVSLEMGHELNKIESPGKDRIGLEVRPERDA